MLHKSKQKLREELREQYAKSILSAYTHSALSQLLKLSEVREASRILAYIPKSDEIPFVGDLQRKFPEKDWFVPTTDDTVGFVSLQDGSEWTADDKKTVVLVPARAATAVGERLGRGGGWYDKFLEQYEGLVYSIVVVPDFALLDRVPVENHDKVVNSVLVATS